jgi:hypothetical protein
MLDAALLAPQSAWLATCPPHAITAVSFFAVNTMLIRRSAVSVYAPLRLYADGLAPIEHGEPLHRLPAAGSPITVPDAVN